MKLFTSEQVKTATHREVEALATQKFYLQKEAKELGTKVRIMRDTFNQEKAQLGTDPTSHILNQKGKLLKELADVEAVIEQKKEMLYGLIEKQDELEEREQEVAAKEANLQLREAYVKAVEHKIVQQSHV